MVGIKVEQQTLGHHSSCMPHQSTAKAINKLFAFSLIIALTQLSPL